jgi:hypothetical protein
MIAVIAKRALFAWVFIAVLAAIVTVLIFRAYLSPLSVMEFLNTRLC